jgi:hypothetical protein
VRPRPRTTRTNVHPGLVEEVEAAEEVEVGEEEDNTNLDRGGGVTEIGLVEEGEGEEQRDRRVGTPPLPKELELRRRQLQPEEEEKNRLLRKD